MNRTIPLVALLLIVGSTVAVAPVAAAEDPRFETYVPEPTLTPGETTSVAIQFLNDADEVDDQVKTAENVKATVLEDSTPFSVRSGTHLLGTLADGQPVTDQFVITVPESIDSGTYDIPIQLTYEFDSDEKETTTVYATVRIDDRAQFVVEDVSSDLRAGDTGTVAVDIRNVGTEAAGAASVTLESKTANVRFGSSATASSFVGEWATNETKTITVDAESPDSAKNGTYSVAATVEYEDPNGNEQTSFPMTVGVTVGPAEDRFIISDVTSSLRVGEEGSVAFTMTNNGAVADDVVVTLHSTGLNVNPLETEFAVGTLEEGQAVPVSFPIEVSDSAEAAPRQFSFTVDYETTDNDQRETKPLNTRVQIEPERDQFLVDPVDATIEAGGGGTVTVEITNNGDDPVTNVNAKIFANDPLSTSDDEAYVESLDPGEATEIKFSVSAAGTALEKAYPLSMDFQFDEGDDSKLSKTYQVPVSVTVPESSGLPITYIIVGVVLLAAAGGYLWYRRR